MMNFEKLHFILKNLIIFYQLDLFRKNFVSSPFRAIRISITLRTQAPPDRDLASFFNLGEIWHSFSLPSRDVMPGGLYHRFSIRAPVNIVCGYGHPESFLTVIGLYPDKTYVASQFNPVNLFHSLKFFRLSCLRRQQTRAKESKKNQQKTAS